MVPTTDTTVTMTLFRVNRQNGIHNGKIRLVFCNFFQTLGTVARCAHYFHLIGIPRDELRHTLALDLLIVHDQQRMQTDPSFSFSFISRIIYLILIFKSRPQIVALLQEECRICTGGNYKNVLFYGHRNSASCNFSPTHLPQRPGRSAELPPKTFCLVFSFFIILQHMLY